MKSTSDSETAARERGYGDATFNRPLREETAPQQAIVIVEVESTPFYLYGFNR